MREYLVVAHKTLVGPHLMEYVRACLGQGPCHFHLVVPVQHPAGAWTDGQVEAAARQRLAEGLEAFRAIGASADGEVGDVNPVYAITQALQTVDHAIDEIILSTLPPGTSRWLKIDALSRVQRQIHLPITHLVAETQTV
jgi:hypothetical protein